MSSAGRLDYLDGWRGVSIGLVLIGHFTPIPFIAWGTLGVSMFFALSGRLMGEILWEQKYPVVPFLERRFSRVWPALFVFVCAMMMIGQVKLLTGLSALTFTYGYYRLYVDSTDVFGHLWSLCVEEHGYAILLLAAIFTARNTRFAVPCLAAAGFLSIVIGIVRTVVLEQSYFESYWLTDSSLHFLTFPALAYLKRDEIARMFGRMSPYVSLVTGALAVLANKSNTPIYVTASLTPILLGLSVALLPNAVTFARSLLAVAPLRWLGLWSFSIYLWQEPMLVAGYGRSPWLLSLAGLCGIALGLISFYVVENPARRWLNRKFSARRKGKLSNGAEKPVAAGPSGLPVKDSI